ncbi:MAG: hypothetical protein MUE40_09155 [Anaerolineae bacterium]|nr:hypothetical protein [Anaerolineae bacterium]
MSLESFIRAMPKVEVHVHLEGALLRETLLMIAEQNDMAATMKPRQWNDWQRLVHRPDATRLDDMMRTFAGWLRHPEDLTRMVYEVGLAFSRQGVRYAEVCVCPILYTDQGMSFEAFLEAINDGRDRVERAWKVRMNWILTVPRDMPRRADDVARWATGAAARRGNVVGMGLMGHEDAQPAGQFAKAFATVEKKGGGRVCHARTVSHVEPLADIVQTLNPSRITDSWGLAEDAAALTLLADRGTPLVITPVREVRLGRIADYRAYPLRQLSDHIRLVIGSGYPELYQTTLTDEYVAVAAQHEMDVNEIEALNLNALAVSFLPEEEKQALATDFKNACQQLRATHLASA